ncbi:MAG: dihydroxyacetone kinase subunit L [Selenomonadaceae bacterium]|nr:dihydroxyacetone kinase subunit L [Selenomonadaceae bacterium]
MTRAAAEAVIKALLSEKDYLNGLDEKLGDGDHGSNMASGALAAKEALDEAGDEADLKKILQAAGDAVIMNVGGTAGPLYGAAFLAAAEVVNKNSALDAATLEKIFGAAVEEIQKRGNAQLGDKTMLDVLIPIREAFNAENCAGKSFEEILTAARDAARDGLEFTKTIAAKKGRAASLGEKSIGFEDPGAASALIIFRALCGYWKDSLRN